MYLLWPNWAALPSCWRASHWGLSSQLCMKWPESADHPITVAAATQRQTSPTKHTQTHTHTHNWILHAVRAMMSTKKCHAVVLASGMAGMDWPYGAQIGRPCHSRWSVCSRQRSEMSWDGTGSLKWAWPWWWQVPKSPWMPVTESCFRGISVGAWIGMAIKGKALAVLFCVFSLYHYWWSLC